MSNSELWNPEIWKRINGAPAQNGQPPQYGAMREGMAMASNGQPAEPGLLKQQMGKIRIAQRIFETTVRGKDASIPADTVDFETRTASEGATKAMVTITQQFILASTHTEDPDLTMAMDQVRLTAQSLALAEDALLFRGEKAVPDLKDVKVTNARALGEGLLGLAPQTIEVRPPTRTDNQLSVFGLATQAAVVKGIALFAGVQAEPFALVLSPAIYADVNTPPFADIPSVAPEVAIMKLLRSGGCIEMSSSLPADEGLLIALGGATTQLYIGTEPRINLDLEQDGKYFFTAKQSFQFHSVDPRSLIKFKFISAPNSPNA